MKINRKFMIGTLLALTMSSIGSAAASGSQTVGGGQWSLSTIPGIYVSASYYHLSKTHSVSVQVGNGKLHKDIKGPGMTARASATGLGTTRAWYNVY